MQKTGIITSQGLKLYYEIEGQGEPLILLNGGPGFSHEYLEPLRALADAAQLVFFDQRGTGQSDKSPARDYTIDAHVEDVEQLRKELGFERIIIFGHSWGGMLAQAYLLKYPERVSKLILANTFSSVEDVNAALRRMRESVPEETRAVYERWEREGLYQGRDTYPEEYQAALDVAYAPVSMSGEPPEPLLNMFSKVAYDVYRVMWGEESEFKITGTLKDFAFAERAPAFPVPTLVMVGASDMPTVEMARGTARLFPNARLEVFERTHHFPFFEEPEKFMEVMRRFFAE